MTPTEAAYLAGFLDGEGCFMDACHSVRVQIGNTFRPLLEELQDRFGGCLSRQPYKPGRQMWQWVACGKDARVVIETVLPYLVEKKPQAALLMESFYYPSKSARRAGIRAHLKAMKRMEHD